VFRVPASTADTGPVARVTSTPARLGRWGRGRGANPRSRGSAPPGPGSWRGPRHSSRTSRKRTVRGRQRHRRIHIGRWKCQTLQVTRRHAADRRAGSPAVARLDVAGAVLAIVAVVALVWALNEGLGRGAHRQARATAASPNRCDAWLRQIAAQTAWLNSWAGSMSRGLHRDRPDHRRLSGPGQAISKPVHRPGGQPARSESVGILSHDLPAPDSQRQTDYCTLSSRLETG